MARRRKIPVRKHHGIRDPLKQKEKLEKSLKNVINSPPTQNDQKLTGKFARFKKLLDDTMAGKKIKRGKLGGREDMPSSAKKVTKPSQKRAIKQFAEETDDEYLRRVNRITRESLNEAQYENKYGVNVIRDAKTGSITIQKRPKNEIDELLKQKANEKRANKGGRRKVQPATKPIDPKIAKQLIKQAIKEDDEERAKENAKELQEYKQDTFKFGEVVHAPPTIPTLPRRAQKNETVPRPGKKNNLLLKSMLTETTKSTTILTPTAKPAKQQKTTDAVTKAQLKGKRKELPAATRSMLESERNKMVEIYRQYKKSKEKSK